MDGEERQDPAIGGSVDADNLEDHALGDSVDAGNLEEQPNESVSGVKMGTRIRGIVVVFSAFCIQVVVFGTSNSIGVYNIHILQEFNAGSAAVSLIGSINLGILLGSGPISSVLMARWSHRKVALVGAVLCNIGLICLPFSPNLLFMYLFYGVLGGLGFSLVYIPSFILSGLFYKKYRSVATGIVSSGAGLGSTLFPFLFYKLIDHFTWRDSLIFVAGINLNLFVFVTLLRQAPPQDHDQSAETKRLLDDKDHTKYAEESEHGSIVAEASTSNKDLLDPVGDDVILASDFKPQDYTSDVIIEESELSSIEEENRLYCHTLRQHVKSVFTFDFILYVISNIGWNAGGGILLIFLPKYMTSIGLTEETASLAFSLFGATRCVGCVSGGFLGNSNCCDRIWLYILANLGAGLVTLAFNIPAFHSLYGQLCLVGIFGFLFGIILSQQVSLTCDLLGTEALGHGFGILMLANGVGIFIGPPIGGALIDLMKTQMVAITLSGAFTIFGGIVMVLVPICQACCRRKKEPKEHQKEPTVKAS